MDQTGIEALAFFGMVALGNSILGSILPSAGPDPGKLWIAHELNRLVSIAMGRSEVSDADAARMLDEVMLVAGSGIHDPYLRGSALIT